MNLERGTRYRGSLRGSQAGRNCSDELTSKGVPHAAHGRASIVLGSSHGCQLEGRAPTADDSFDMRWRSDRARHEKTAREISEETAEIFVKRMDAVDSGPSGRAQRAAER